MLGLTREVKPRSRIARPKAERQHVGFHLETKQRKKYEAATVAID
jgi:hypothetical protein